MIWNILTGKNTLLMHFYTLYFTECLIVLASPYSVTVVVSVQAVYNIKENKSQQISVSQAEKVL